MKTFYILLLMLIPFSAQADTVTFTWTANTTNTDGYFLYQNSSANMVSEIQGIDNATASVEVANDLPCTNYFLTAYNGTGEGILESGASDIVTICPEERKAPDAVFKFSGNASSTESEARVLLDDIEVWDGLPNEGPDVTAPTLATVTAVPTPSEDITPSFTFSSTEAGTIAYGGSCSSATTTANSGNNTITFNALAVGTYSDCTITVTDAATNASTPLTVGTFVINASDAEAACTAAGNKWSPNVLLNSNNVNGTSWTKLTGTTVNGSNVSNTTPAGTALTGAISQTITGETAGTYYMEATVTPRAGGHEKLLQFYATQNRITPRGLNEVPYTVSKLFAVNEMRELGFKYQSPDGGTDFNFGNAKLIKTSEIDIYSVGDSICNASYTLRSTGEKTSWRGYAYTNRYSKANGLHFVNAGVGGRVLSQIHTRLTEDFQIITNKPLLFLEGGVNDIFAATENPVEAMKTELLSIISEAQPKVSGIVIFTIPQILANGAAKEPWRTSYNSWLHQLAADNNYQIVDTESVWSSGGSRIAAYYTNGDDRTHPNHLAHEKLAQCMTSGGADCGTVTPINLNGLQQVSKSDLATQNDRCVVPTGNYYVSATGLDTNDGRTEATPWRTIAKVNSSTFVSGDTISFKRGDTFRVNEADGTIFGGFLEPKQSGTAGNPITYGAYGAGAKPIILGSANKSTAGNWTNSAGNVWYTQMVAHVDVGNLIFGTGNLTAGVKKFNATDLTTQGDFYFNPTNDRVEMYSVGNPATFYTRIEAALGSRIILIKNRSYITVENIDFRYSGQDAVFVTTSDNFIVKNCDMSWLGGVHFLNAGNPTTRLGNGITMWSNTHHGLIEGNKMYQIYDTGISNQTNGAVTTQDSIVFRNNIVRNSYYGIEFFSSNPEAVMSNITYDHNTIIDTGEVWSYNQRTDAGHDASGIQIWRLGAATTTNIKVTNNIISGSTDQLLRKRNGESWDVWHDHIDVSNNCWYQPNAADRAWRIVEGGVHTVDYTLADFETYKTTENKDAGSIISNPNFDANFKSSGACAAYGAFGIEPTDPCKNQTTLTGLTSCLKEHMPASASEGIMP